MHHVSGPSCSLFSLTASLICECLRRPHEVAVICSLFSSWFFSIHRCCMRHFRGVLQDLFRHPFSVNLPKSFTNLLRQSPFSCPHTLKGPGLFNSPHTAAAAFSLIAWLPFFLGLRGYLSNLVEISLAFLLCCILKLK